MLVNFFGSLYADILVRRKGVWLRETSRRHGNRAQWHERVWYEANVSVEIEKTEKHFFCTKFVVLWDKMQF